MFLHGMSWLTIVVLPVVLLLYIQLVFLPYHDVAITWMHRLTLIADIALAGVHRRVPVAAGDVVLPRLPAHQPASSRRACCSPPRCWPASAAFSLFIATIPGEAIDQPLPSPARAKPARRARSSATPCRPSLLAPRARCSASFTRNLNVTDTDLVVDKDVTPGEPSLNLRGRDLRFAKLDRTDLHQADLTGANLDGASLVGADLRAVWLSCADLNVLLLTDSRRRRPLRKRARRQSRQGAARRRPRWPASTCARPGSRRRNSSAPSWPMP